MEIRNRMLFIYTPHPPLYTGYVVVGVSAALMLRTKEGSIKRGRPLGLATPTGKGRQNTKRKERTQ